MTVRVALLTAAGRSALAALALTGPGAEKVLQLAGVEAGRFRLTRLGAGLSDEVVIAVHRLEPVPWIEIHCHGGEEVVRLLFETLVERGAVPAAWSDLIEDEALALLPYAPTARIAGILLDQHGGAYRRAIERIRTTTDDNELPTLARNVLIGARLLAGWRVAIAGKPNVGKSSLLNALAGYARTIVNETPGTTRDLVRVGIALEGWPIELIDTAGLRDEADDLETQGMDLAREAIATADLCLWILDATAEPIRPDVAIATPILFVVNKVDQPATWTPSADMVRVSAQTGEGLLELGALIVAALIPDPPARGDAVPVGEAQCRDVQAALAALEQGNTEEACRVLV